MKFPSLLPFALLAMAVAPLGPVTSLHAADPAPAPAPAAARTSLIIATGAKGEDTYQAPFALWTVNWKLAGQKAAARLVSIAADDNDAREHLKKALEEEPKQSPDALWLVLLGHGSFDGREGKFNLPGDDLSATDLAEWLKPFQRPVVVICGFSASGAFLKPLSAEGRVIITATRNGAENNYSRFPGYLSETIAGSGADLDKDGQTSLLEAWLAAAQRTADFYKNDERLATEHSLLDDNGDGFGTPPDWFQGIRVVKKSSDRRLPDGLRAHQLHLIPNPAEKDWPPERRTERDRLELEISRLRESKSSREPDDYYKELEALLLKLAQVYKGDPTPTPSAPQALPTRSPASHSAD